MCHIIRWERPNGGQRLMWGVLWLVKGHITEREIWKVLKKVAKKTPGINGCRPCLLPCWKFSSMTEWNRQWFPSITGSQKKILILIGWTSISWSLSCLHLHTSHTFTLDWPFVCKPQCHGESEWSKIKAHHLDQIHLPGLSPLALVLYACTRAFPAQVKGKS